MPYEDADGAYPKYKGQIRTHYKILNRGDLDSDWWAMDIAINDSGKWSVVDKNGFSFSSKKEGLLVPAHGERGFFVPSIIQGDDRYDNFNGPQMLVRIRYEDDMDKEYCTCRYFNEGIEQERYINTKREEGKKIFFKNVDRKGKCKDCRWDKSVSK